MIVRSIKVKVAMKTRIVYDYAENEGYMEIM